MDKETEKRIAEQKKINQDNVATLSKAVDNGFVFFHTKPYDQLIEMAEAFNAEHKKDGKKDKD